MSSMLNGLTHFTPLDYVARQLVAIIAGDAECLLLIMAKGAPTR